MGGPLSIGAGCASVHLLGERGWRAGCLQIPVEGPCRSVNFFHRDFLPCWLHAMPTHLIDPYLEEHRVSNQTENYVDMEAELAAEERAALLSNTVQQ